MHQHTNFLDYTPNFRLFKITNTNQVTTNPTQYLKVYLKEAGLSYIPAKQYYKQVVCNTIIKTNDTVSIVNKLLQVSTNVNRTLYEMTSVFYRYIYNTNFASLVDKVHSSKQKANLFWSDKRVEQELKLCGFTKQIDYEGNISLPPNCMLVTKHEQLKSIAIQMDNCIDDYWRKLVAKECFIIQKDGSNKISFCISINPYMQCFNITEAKGFKNSKVKVEDVVYLAKIITSSENQAFFSRNTNLTKMAAKYFKSPISHSLINMQQTSLQNMNDKANKSSNINENLKFELNEETPKKKQPFIVFNKSIFYTEGVMQFMSKLDKSTLYDMLKENIEEIEISDAILDLVLEHFLKRTNLNFENISHENKEKVKAFEYNFKNFLASVNSYVLLDKLKKDGLKNQIYTIHKSHKNSESFKILSTIDDSILVEYLSNKGFYIINRNHSYTLYHMLCDIFRCNYFTQTDQLASYVKNYAKTTSIAI